MMGKASGKHRHSCRPQSRSDCERPERMMPPAAHHFTDAAGNLGGPDQRAERNRFGEREAALLQQGQQMHRNDGDA